MCLVLKSSNILDTQEHISLVIRENIEKLQWFTITE